MSKAGGMIIYRMHFGNSGTEILLGDVYLKGKPTGKITLCFATRVRPDDADEKSAAERALFREAGTEMVLGPPRELGTYGPTIFKCIFELGEQGKVVGLKKTTEVVSHLDTTTKVYTREYRKGNPRDSEAVRNLRFASIREVTRHRRDLLHDQKEIFFYLLGFLRTR